MKQSQSNHTNEKRQEKTRKATRRVPVTIKWLRWCGIQRGDKAIIAMTGDVRVGELGYFSIWHSYQAYKQLRFVCEQDEHCRGSHPSTCTPGGICLRERRGVDGHFAECIGSHDGLAYGRVCAIERQDRPVETTLNLRPYDEREGPATTRLDMDAEAPPKPTTKPTADAITKTFTTGVDVNLPGYGLFAGDAVTVEETRDLRTGDLVWFYRAGGTGASCGRFVSLDDDTLTITDSDGEQYEYDDASKLRLGRITAYTRTVSLVRPKPIPEGVPQDLPAQVIDLLCYRQAHPQRIRNLLFAEKA